MTNPIKGMVAIISNYGVGKTTFALECGYHPEEMIFINDDLKDTGIDNNLFKRYINLVSDTKNMPLMKFHQYCNELIGSLPETKVIIWDTWTRYASAFFHYVKSHENEFRGPKEWAGKPSIKASEWYNESWQYQGRKIDELKSKCDLLVLSFHLKQLYVDNVPIPGKHRPGHDKAIDKYADLRIWLTPNVNSQVPVGLVLKNISKRHIVKNQGIRTSQVLPLRIPQCNWQSIFEYWESPIGDREPTEDERPNSFELSLIEGTLTPEDKRLYEASLSLVEKQQQQEQAEMLLIRSEQEKAIREYISKNFNGLPDPIKFDKVNEAVDNGELIYDGEITRAKISEWSE